MSATLHTKLFLCLNVMQTNLFYAITFSPLAAEAVKNGDEKISRVDGRTGGRARDAAHRTPRSNMSFCTGRLGQAGPASGLRLFPGTPDGS
jgi:hypothetical protein